MISLYDCFEAKVDSDRIKCAKGHAFSAVSADGTIGSFRLAKGAPLELESCQGCPDFNKMDGGKVIEKGWIRIEE